MDVNAHLQVEMVLNESDNEEEKRFNEIICYDSGEDSSHENEYSGPSGTFNNDIASQNQEFNSTNLSNEQKLIQKKSNAAQMRKYRARQRSDPIRYQQYLARERMRNYKRKYEKRIKDAQERAIAMGIPYIVLEPLHSGVRRGRRPIFPSEAVSFVLPSKFEDYNEGESNSNSLDGMPFIPVKVELQESDEIYQEQKPNLSVINIEKLMNHPRSALQTLLPQEVHDRERVSNFIKLDHDYVKKRADRQDNISLQSESRSSNHLNKMTKCENPIEQEKRLDRKKKRRSHKYELLKLQEQCRSFILNKASSGEALKKRTRRSNMSTMRKPTSDFVNSDCVEHEDLDDLFKELAEVANKEPQKKKHSSKTSPRKNDGQFSLTVSMPVQPIVVPKRKTNIKNYLENVKQSGVPISNTMFVDDMQLTKKPIIKIEEPFNCNEDSIEIIKQEPMSSDDDFQ